MYVCTYVRTYVCMYVCSKYTHRKTTLKAKGEPRTRKAGCVSKTLALQIHHLKNLSPTTLAMKKTKQVYLYIYIWSHTPSRGRGWKKTCTSSAFIFELLIWVTWRSKLPPANRSENERPPVLGKMEFPAVRKRCLKELFNINKGQEKLLPT